MGAGILMIVAKWGQGYAQNDDHLRNMEREAYEKGNMCFRDWEDGIKNTIYFEHLQKGESKKMSTKDWKNKELKTLLTENWGFKMDLNKLTEDIGGAAGELTDSEAEEEETGKPPVSKDEKEGNLEEECPGHEMGGEMDGPVEPMGAHQDVQALAARAMAAISDLVAAAGGGMDTTVATGDEPMMGEPMMEEEEPVDERRGRGRKGRHIRGPEDNRLRPEHKVRQMIRKAVKEAVKAR